MQGKSFTIATSRTAAPQHLRGAVKATRSIRSARPHRRVIAARQSMGVAIVIDVPGTSPALASLLRQKTVCAYATSHS
ncbi:hypothetical protein Y032_0016g2933 [Ancylostoma ceylanicum]|uniref:Uncharacterized protein n=1 Tax=Ancylostoma ceylanicum TaxID=53326 RepID=A0A016V6X4_9BILA|nr:hypothetical protein Y032_0016g2933 [Ancylostoma ceylanicum]